MYLHRQNNTPSLLVDVAVVEWLINLTALFGGFADLREAFFLLFCWGRTKRLWS